MRAKMASHHARIFHGKCMAAKVSLAQAADSETKKAVIDSQVEMLVVTLEHALATREHGEAIEKNLDEVLAAEARKILRGWKYRQQVSECGRSEGSTWPHLTR